MLAKCPLQILAKCPLAKCPLAKCPLAKCPGFTSSPYVDAPIRPIWYPFVL